MKKSRRTLYFFIILIITPVIVIGLKNWITSPPKAKITASNGDVIKHIVEKNYWSNKVYDREDSFTLFLEKHKIQTLSSNQEISIRFSRKVPDTIEICTFLIHKNDSKDVHLVKQDMIKPEKKQKNIHYQFGEIDSKYDANEYDIGVKIMCLFGSNDCEYVFISKSK